MLGRSGSPFRSFQHPRGRGGKFAAKPGELRVLGRGGRARGDMPALSPQHVQAQRTRQMLDRVRASLKGRVPDAALVTFYGLLGSLHARADSPIHPAVQDPTSLLDWIGNATTSLRLVGRALASSPDLLHGVLRLIAAAEAGELSDEELAVVEAWAREG